MKSKKIRAFAMFLSAAVVLSLTVPALAGDAELSSGSAYEEDTGSAYEEDAGSAYVEPEEVPAAGPETESQAAPAEEEISEEEEISAEEEISEGAEGSAEEKTPEAEALQAVPVEPEVMTYTVSLRQTDGGRIFFRDESEELTEKVFAEGEEVVLCAVPDEGYRTETVTVLYEDGTETAADHSEEEDVWTCIPEPGNVQAGALFVKKDGHTPPDSKAEKTETEPEEEHEEEEKEEVEDAEPAASSRLLVKTEDTGFLDPDAVIGVIGDVYLLQFDSEEDAGKALADYEEKAEFAAEDIPVRAASYGEFPVSEEQIPMMTETENPFTEAEQTVPASAGGRVIALIDTGVSAGQQTAGIYSVLGDDGLDGNGHGSAMLEMIRGFDSDAQVVSIKALDDSGVGTVSSLYAAIRMAIDMHASIINLSLSAYCTEGNEAVAAIIREAAAGGITVVGAAGNNGTDAGAYIPACIPEAVIAGACNRQGERLPSSNYGSAVDLSVLAGSSSYAAAALSGIISAEGGVPSPDGIAVFAPAGQTAASDYVDGLCYDSVSGNFRTAGVSYTVHNAGGKRLTDLIPGLTYDSLKAWLGSHENDDYYLGTPYPEQVVGGVPQYILGRNGDCDNRNPNGDCADIHGNDDYAGKAMMNCTGFVWHALWKASGLSYPEGISRIPAWGGIGAGSWKSFIQNNGLEYMTVKSGGTNEINDMLGTAMWSAKGPDGRIFLEKGDIIWFWVDQIPLGGDDLPVNGYYGGLSDKAHVGIYWPESDSNDNRWWDSLGICEYQGDSGYYLRNMLHQFTPKTGSVAMTIIKLGRTEEKKPGKVNVQKSSADSALTDGNPLYSYAGAKYAVYGSKADAEAKTNAVAVMTTDQDGYGESGELPEAGKMYYIREIEPPASYLPDPEIYSMKAVEADRITKKHAVRSTETPVSDTADLGIEKVSETEIPAGEGKSLAGTQFTIRYYKGAYTKLSDLPKPDRTWVLEARDQSDGTCRAFLLPEYKVSGDELYYLPGGTQPVLPLGTVTIEETKAPEGYHLENRFRNGAAEASGVFLAGIRKNGDAVQLVYGNTVIREDGFTASDAPVRGGVKIRKLDADMKLDMDGKPYAEGDKTLKDAEFTIFSKNDYAVQNKDGRKIASGGVMQIIKTDENGGAATGSRDLPYGTYEIRETKASDGFKLNTSWSRTFSVQEDGKVTALTGEADICYEPDIRGGVQLQKTDRELGKAEACGAGSFAGIRYQIVNSSAHAVKNRDGKIIRSGEIVMEIITDANGTAATGPDDLPYGTYTLRELPADDSGRSANDSYLTDGAEDAVFRIREDGKIVTADKDGKEIVFANQVKRNDLSFRKVESGSERPIGSIPFVIENTATGEKHVIVTDENGLFSSTKYPHSMNTNANDGLLESAASGTPVQGQDLVRRSGCWFGLGQKGTAAEVKDTLPAFPYGRYTITELRCEANEGYELISGYPFVIEEDTSETGGEALTLHNLHNIPVLPKIRTMALDDKTKEHIMAAGPEASLTDTVSAENLVKGTKYVLTATLMDGETGNALRYRDADGVSLKVTGEKAFTASEGKMKIPVPVSLNAGELAGRTLVVYEQLYCVEDDGSRTPVAEHKELGDRDQTIVIPDIHTSFTDAETGSQTGIPKEEQKVCDTVWYTGLIPGKEASVTAAVMTVGEDGRGTELKDKNGETVTKTVTFIPEKSEGSVTVEFTIDSSLLTGKKAVCFEEISYDGIPVAVHADITDQDQTIWYPEIRTAAKSKTTGDHAAAVSEKEIFADTVAYAGLKPGEIYTVRAVLMDAESGGPVLVSGKEVTAEAEFRPEKDCGETVVEIPVNTEEITGRKTVVFEELYHQEKLIAEHKDLSDPEQQIVIPEIRTSLKDDVDGGHTAAYGEKVKLTDTVNYRGLLPGKEYRLAAVLMTEDESGNGTEITDPEGKPYTAEKVFTAKEADGGETVTFTVDTTRLAGKKIVCFETLYLSGVKLAVHADLQDRDQTVTVPSIRTEAADAVNGKHISSEGNTVFIDTVSYTGLVPGTAYIIRGSLMNAETGKAISSGFLKKATAETEFTPETEDGTAAVSFSVNTEKLAGVTAVVFEELYRKTDSGREILTAVHKDLSDTGQQVHIPEVKTSAFIDGEKECTASKNTRLTDVVSYRNLIPGESYVLKGKLVDKKSGRTVSVNSKGIKAKKTFTAASAHGMEELTFTLDSTLLGGRTFVVFEELYIENDEGKEVKIASHADIDDAEQSVRILPSENKKTPSKTITPTAGGSPAGTAGVSAPRTGDSSRQGLYLLLAAGAAAAGVLLLIIRRKAGQNI